MKIFDIEIHKKAVRNRVKWSPNRRESVSLDLIIESLCQFEKQPFEYVGKNNNVAYNKTLRKVFDFYDKPPTTPHRDYLLYLEQFKVCKSCKIIKSHEEFHNDNNRSDGKAYACKDCTRQYAKNNKETIQKYKKKYKLSILPNTPKWLTIEMWEEINNIYIEARYKSKNEQIQYHVDHIIPLKGKLICGLNVPWNLQIITAEDNLKKGNKYKCEY